jgi:hypothetical protein
MLNATELRCKLSPMEYEVESPCIGGILHIGDEEDDASAKDTESDADTGRASPSTGRLPSPTNHFRSLHYQNTEPRRPMSRTASVITNSTCAGPDLLSKLRSTKSCSGQNTTHTGIGSCDGTCMGLAYIVIFKILCRNPCYCPQDCPPIVLSHRPWQFDSNDRPDVGL